MLFLPSNSVPKSSFEGGGLEKDPGWNYYPSLCFLFRNYWSPSPVFKRIRWVMIGFLQVTNAFSYPPGG